MFVSLQFKLELKREGKQKLIRLVPLSAGGRPDEGFLKAASLSRNICDKKGGEEYKSGYSSKNQCEDGEKKIESNLQLAERYGISGTPTFIGMNGKIYTDLPTEQDLDKLIQ
jgi:thiol:disulfide interchange protein DsbC